MEPKHVQTHLSLAIEAQQHGDIATAMQQCHLILNEDETYSPAWHLLGLLHAQQDNYVDAQTCLAQALSLDPTQPLWTVHYGNVCKHLNDHTRAKTYYLKALELDPTLPTAHNNLANLLLLEENVDAAKTHYQKAIEAFPEYEDAHYNLARLWYQQGMFAEAAEAFETALAACGEQPRLFMGQSEVFIAQSKFDDAIASLTACLAGNPQHVSALQHLGVCYLRKQAYDKAKDVYETLLGLTPYDPDVSYNLGTIANIGQRYQEAMNYYLGCITCDNTYLNAHLNVAMLYCLFENDDMAIDHLKKILAIDPNHVLARYHLSALTGEQVPDKAPNDYVAALFNQYSQGYNESLANTLNYQVPQALAKILSAYSHMNPFETVIDLGCGTGLCGIIAREFCTHLIGIDIAENMLAQAKALNIYDQLICADLIEGLNGLPHPAPIMIAGDVLNYFGDLRTLLAAVYARLSPSGLFFFTTEAGHCDSYQLARTSRYQHNDMYVRQCARTLGFDVSDCLEITLREQKGVPVKGHLFVLRRP